MASDPRQAGDNEKGVPQIEVTPEMIEAAYRVWEDSGKTDYVSPSDKVFLHEVIVAALRTRGPVRQIPRYTAPEDETIG